MRFSDLLDRVRAEAEAGREPKPGAFITISRQAGCGGAEVARHLGSLTGWPVLDRELIQDLARRLELDPRLLEMVDESRVGWFSETMLSILNPSLIAQDSYLAMISRSISVAVCDRPVIVVGRGGHLLLPADRGLRVRCVAPREQRVRRIAEREGIDPRQAEKRMDAVDRSRADFIRRNFRVDPEDVGHFDLVVDVSRFGIAGAADLLRDSLVRARVLDRTAGEERDRTGVARGTVEPAHVERLSSPPSVR
jgi:cytidylate kinase